MGMTIIGGALVVAFIFGVALTVDSILNHRRLEKAAAREHELKMLEAQHRINMETDALLRRIEEQR